MANERLTELPEAPAGLCPVACAEWTRAGEFLIGLRMLAVGDLGVLEHYARLHARLRRLEAAIAGAPLTTSEGKPHPLIPAANQTSASLAKVAGLLGVAPVTRAKLKKDPVEDEPEDHGLADVVRLRRG